VQRYITVHHKMNPRVLKNRRVLLRVRPSDQTPQAGNQKKNTGTSFRLLTLCASTIVAQKIIVDSVDFNLVSIERYMYHVKCRLFKMETIIMTN
jgi:hypothetical protein